MSEKRRRQIAIVITVAIIHMNILFVVIFLFGVFDVLCEILSSPTIVYLLLFLREEVFVWEGL